MNNTIECTGLSLADGIRIAMFIATVDAVHPFKRNSRESHNFRSKKLESSVSAGKPLSQLIDDYNATMR